MGIDYQWIDSGLVIPVKTGIHKGPSSYGNLEKMDPRFRGDDSGVL
jgi:hypothetical protein